jgi:hypothetical protein
LLKNVIPSEVEAQPNAVEGPCVLPVELGARCLSPLKQYLRLTRTPHAGEQLTSLREPNMRGGFEKKGR